ncbi:MAG: hypothetical protein VXW97_04575 [Pseudomonadota bacterium]|nr:hypothetical protein [Pseudomonadota bacterium]
MGNVRQSKRNKNIILEKNQYNYFGRKICHRLSNSKLKLINEILPKIKITKDFLKKNRNKKNFTKKDIILEVGFGMGDNLKHMISNNKNSIFIGCEPYLNGIANFLSKINDNDYERVKIFDEDARILLNTLPDDFFSNIILLFPDPWKKRRHKKRRLLNELNINIFLRTLKKNGKIYFGTDVENYFSEVRNILLEKKIYIIENEKNFYSLPKMLCETKYAKKSIKKGIIPKYLVVKKNVDIL